jgi:hypothetical protein
MLRSQGYNQGREIVTFLSRPDLASGDLGLLEQMPKEISEMVAAPRGSLARRGGRTIPIRLGLLTQRSQRPLAAPAFPKPISLEVLGRRPGCNGLSAVSSAQRPRSSDIGLCLFLADRPFHLGHLEISFGICSSISVVESFQRKVRNTKKKTE